MAAARAMFARGSATFLGSKKSQIACELGATVVWAQAGLVGQLCDN